MVRGGRQLGEVLAGRRDRFPLMARTAEAIAAKLGFLGGSIALAAERYGEDWWESGEAHCRRLSKVLGGDEGRWQKAVQGYCAFSLEYLQLQRRLEQEKRYLLSSFEEANAKVYGNAQAMEGYYLDGLCLSLLFWPNHYGIFRLFRESFLPLLPASGRVLEVGTGNGVYTAALAGKGLQVEGADVSPSSLDYTRRMLRESGVPEGRVRLSLTDIAKGLPFPDAHFGGSVCGEVLEHLEDPGAALREIARVTAPGAPVFLTAAVFAASLDHIFLFRSAAEARDLIRAAGFAIGEELALPVRPEDDPEAREVPVNYACIARRSA